MGNLQELYLREGIISFFSSLNVSTLGSSWLFVGVRNAHAMRCCQHVVLGDQRTATKMITTACQQRSSPRKTMWLRLIAADDTSDFANNTSLVT